MRRREELAALEDELARAMAGEFRLVLLVGNAGVGKSRLARELPARHRDVDRLRSDIVAGLSALGLIRPVIEVTVVERMERTPGPAKLRRFRRWP